MRNTLQITPFMHVRDMEAALAFFTRLGFEAAIRMGNYAYVEREGVGIRVLEHDDAGEISEGKRNFRYYIDVADVDQVYQDLADTLAAMPAGDVVGPVDQHYRQRELMILGPDGDLLVFGAAIPD